MRARDINVRWVKLYPDAWFNSESRLTMSLAERGAFRDLQDYCSIQGSIPAETSLIAKILGVTETEMESVWPRVSKEFSPLKEAGRLVNAEASEALAEARKFMKKQAANGKKGGRPKKNPHGTQTKPMGLPNETQALTHSKPITVHNNTEQDTTEQTEQEKQTESSSSSSKETGEEPALRGEHRSTASAAALTDGWGKSFQKLKQSFPTISVKVFFRLVEKVKFAGFTDDELAAGIEEHGGRILSLNTFNLETKINPITFGLKVIDAIKASARSQDSLRRLTTASAETRAEFEPPRHEPSIGLSIVGLCPKHKHEVVWIPVRGEEVCVECTEPPGELAAEAKERVARWFEDEKEIGLGSGTKQLTERLATL